MHKKLMLACMAIAAFAAFVIAPAAQGAVLTENGTALATGTSVTAKNTGITKFTGGFGVECEVAHLAGTVTTNSGGVVKGEIPATSATFTNTGGTACKSLLGATTVKVTSNLCLELPKGTDILTVKGCSGNVVFDLTASGVTCKYEAASVSGTATTNSTPATANVSEQPAKEVGGSFFCPDEGKLDMDFDLYTTGGTIGLTLS
jgi:hypothetical protein